jgi:hypothetical protein
VRWPAFILAIGHLLSSASGEAAPATELKRVHVTPRVAYFASGKRKVDVRRTEEFLRRLDGLFGPPEDGRRIEYRLHDAHSLRFAETGQAAVGVTDLDALRIDTVLEYHPHELTHAVAGRLGRPPLLFAEGLAVALTSGGLWRGRDLDAAAERALAAGARVDGLLTGFLDAEPDAAYAVAGSFVAHLLERHGIDPLVRFFRGCGDGGSGFEQAFRRAYGHSIARATIEWGGRLGRSGPAARAFYDPGTWPGSLRRGPVEGTVETARAATADRTRGVAGDPAALLMPAGAEELQLPSLR